MSTGDVPSELPLVDSAKSEGKKYPFIDFIRFISMMGIVWAHTEAFSKDYDTFHFLKQNGNAVYYIFYKQIFKFSVFAFFMISGFLLGDKITHVSPLHYLKRRINSTLRPYIISLIFFLIIFFAVDLSINHATYSLIDLIKSSFYIITATPFWFIPTFFISLVIILIFIRFVDSYMFGGVLFAITMFFTFPNSYTQHYIHGPNTVFFGYIFYIWFGIYVRRNGLIERFKTYNIYVLIIAVVTLYILSSLESLRMFNRNEFMFFNILRITNQLYGIAFFIFLVRICSSHPNFGIFNPRKETYGIYLYHFYFVAFIFPMIFHWMQVNTSLNFNNTFTVIGLSTLHFLLCYLSTTLWVKLLVRYKIPVL